MPWLSSIPNKLVTSIPIKTWPGWELPIRLRRRFSAAMENATPDFQLEDLLDLVALGTVADLAPLVGENRILVRKGLQKIRETKRQGLFSLAAVSDLRLATYHGDQHRFHAWTAFECRRATGICPGRL